MWCRTQILCVVWTSLLKGINMTGKNVQQISQGIVRQIKVYRKVLSNFASNAKAELTLLNTLQVCWCGCASLGPPVWPAWMLSCDVDRSLLGAVGNYVKANVKLRGRESHA